MKESRLPKILDTSTLCISGQRPGYSEGGYNALKGGNIDHEMIDGKTVSVPTIEHSVIPRGKAHFSADMGTNAVVYTKDSPTYGS